jgi:hypothetical protein
VNETTEAMMTDLDTMIDLDTTTDPLGKLETTLLGTLPETFPEMLLEVDTTTGEAVVVAVATTDRGTERMCRSRTRWLSSVENGNPYVGTGRRILAFLKHVCIH